MKKVIATGILGMFMSHAIAEGIAANYYVDNVRVDKSGKGYVKFLTALIGAPATCASAHANHLAFDANQPAGQAIMSLALAAQASGKKIYAKGTNICDIYGTVESWDYGWVGVQ